MAKTEYLECVLTDMELLEFGEPEAPGELGDIEPIENSDQVSDQPEPELVSDQVESASIAQTVTC